MRKAVVILFILVFSFIATAQENVSSPDLCANVACQSPPAAFCRDDKTYVKYSSSGTCEPSNGQCRYIEQITTCGQSSVTCPDGFVATCQQTCDTAAGCSSCAPSCAGHEAQPINATPPPACPPQPEKPVCPPDAYPNPQYDSKGCVTGYECTAIQPPSAAAPPSCIQVITPAMDAAGNCKEFSTSCLPPGWNKVDRCPGQTSVCGNNVCEFREDAVNCPGDCRGRYVCGNNICEGDLGESNNNCPNDCQRSDCPVHPAPICERGFAMSGSFDEKGCRGPPTCCGDGVCSGGENSYNCRQDCVGGEPDKVQCPDGSFAACKIDSRGVRYCEPCRVPENVLPPECRQEVDKETGFVKVVCENIRRVCPAISIPEDAKQRCEESGGRFEVRKDFSGCEFPGCIFGEVSTAPVPVFNPLEPEKRCPVETEEQREATRQGCDKLGLNFVISVQGGCKISKCSAKPQKRGCEPLPFEERQKIENECSQRGLGIVKDFDESGCPLMRCGETAQCSRDLPKEAYERCGQRGGELVIRRDDRGCIALSQCLVQGDVREADVDPIERIPEPAELLSMAFRLEQLKIELDKLSRKTDDIANYYASVNSPDEGRYRRVSDMFEAAKDKVDEIKAKLRDAVQEGDIMEDDLIEVKRDIRYIKDVMMKDILYLMLSSSEDVNDIKESRAVKRDGRFEEVEATDDTNCGSDGSCFDRGFRLCKKLIFYPEGSRGPKVEVRGLEGDECIMYAVLPEGEGPPPGAISGINPPYDMTCKIKKYALGVRTPEEDIFPYCEGPMVELMKKFGTGPGGEGGPGVPGKCQGDECREYCGRGPEEARECLEQLGPYLPPEAKEGLERLSRGEQFGGFERRGEFREEFRGGQYPPPPSGGEFVRPEEREEFREPLPPREFQPPGEQCSGCLNNNICDPGECSFCPDCQRR